MTLDDIQRTVEEFTKRLQLPESKYSFAVNIGNEAVEFIIFVNDAAKMSVSIGNGTLRVLYTDGYNSDKYASQKFLTPITLVYWLCILFYGAVASVSEMSFNDLLSVIFLNDIYDWRTLAEGICENVGMEFDRRDDSIFINGVELSYNGFLNQVRIDNQEIKLENSEYTTAVEAIFKCVEYVANVMGAADDLFKDENYEEEENNLLEEEGAEAPGGGMPSMDMDVDFGGGEMPEEGEAPAPVPPMENETFEEPQSPVVEIDDLIE